MRSYDRYLKARGLESREWEPARDPGLSATVHFRERDDDVSFRGQRCRKCQSVQFPKQRVCESCFAKDDFEGLRLSDRIGTVVTYTFDYFFPTPDPPTVVAIVEVEDSPSKGLRPEAISYRTMPSEKMSERESRRLPSTCSGDM